MADSSWDSGGQAHRVMEGLVRDFGPQVLSNAQLLRNLLGDKLPTAPKETSLLVAAAEAGMAPLLRDLLGQQLPPDAAIREAAIALEERRGYDLTACTWVVTEFARAMGHDVAAFEDTLPGPVSGNGAGGATRQVPVPPPIDTGWGTPSPAPPPSPPPFQAPPVPPPPAPSAGNRQLPVILAIVAAVVVVVVIVVLLATRKSNDKNITLPPSGTSATTATTAPNQELAQGQAIQSIVAQSAQARPGVGNAVNAISSCGDLDGAVATLQNAAQTRHSLVTQASGLDVKDIPNGDAVRQSLVRALDASATADQDYAAWGRDVVAGGFCQGSAPQDGNYTAATNSDQDATGAKQQFAGLWNPTAQQLGLPAADPNQF